MAISTCHSCGKAQPFMERMMYCSFCGAHHTETEMSNGSQRLRQDMVVGRFSFAYAWGGLITFFIVIPALLNAFVPNESSRSIFFLFFLFLWWLLITKKPFALKIAKKLYPEKSVE